MHGKHNDLLSQGIVFFFFTMYKTWLYLVTAVYDFDLLVSILHKDEALSDFQLNQKLLRRNPHNINIIKC